MPYDCMGSCYLEISGLGARLERAEACGTPRTLSASHLPPHVTLGMRPPYWRRAMLHGAQLPQSLGGLLHLLHSAHRQR